MGHKGNDDFDGGEYRIMKVEGAEELMKRFAQIPPAVQRVIMKQAIVPAMNNMKAVAIQNVSNLPSLQIENRGARHAIASKIKVVFSNSRGMSKGRLAVWGGMSAKARPKFPTSASQLATLSHLLEFGFKSAYYFGMRIKPKTIQPRAFMKPAFEQNKGKVIPMIHASIETALRKLGS